MLKKREYLALEEGKNFWEGHTNAGRIDDPFHYPARSEVK